MILVAVSTWYTYNAILGYGTEFKPAEKVVYHSHVADKKAGRIYILLTTFGEDEPRLHIYPWSEELEKQLKGADGQNKAGALVVGKLKQNFSPAYTLPLFQIKNNGCFMRCLLMNLCLKTLDIRLKL